MNIKVHKLIEGATLPTKGSEKAAGWDLYAYVPEGSVIISAGQTGVIGTGLSFELPDNIMGCVYARSGLAKNNGIRPANCVGICDPDYRGEYVVLLHNDSTEDFKVTDGMRIAQLIFQEFIPDIEFTVVDELSETERGEGGFGSTGV